jgi:hypothetical protein
MSKGVLYKANGSAWSKSQAMKGNGDYMTKGKIMHSNGTTWYDNFPMEEYFTREFPVTWSQGYKVDGTPLHDTAWYGNIITGSTTNYRGMLGFNQGEINSFISGGTVTSAKLLINCYETTLNGSPDVVIGKHQYTSEPAEGSYWNGETNAYWGDYSTLHVPNKKTGGYWVTLKPSQITFNGKAIGGIALRGASATAEDMGKFSGKNQFTSKLQITVLK